MPVLNSIGRVAAQSITMNMLHCYRLGKKVTLTPARFAILGGYVLGMRTRALPLLGFVVQR